MQQANQSNLEKDVAVLTAVQPARIYSAPEQLAETARWIQNRFHENGLTAELHPFTVDGTTYYNVIAKLNEDKLPRLIIGAHYDVDGIQPGADDNASAVAGLLEIARLLKNQVANTPYCYEFVAYCLEEQPYFRTKQMGSYVHAAQLKQDKVWVRGMICLEMLGYYTDAPNSQQYPSSLLKWFYPNEGNFIAVVGNFSSWSLLQEVKRGMRQQTAVPVAALAAPKALRGVDFSDHRNYWHFNFPAVMITDTAFYRNPHYHLPSDTAATLDFPKMCAVVGAVTDAILNLK